MKYEHDRLPHDLSLTQLKQILNTPKTKLGYEFIKDIINKHRGFKLK